MRRTKIVCTIGPASDSITMIKKLLMAGMNVARLNFSHGTQNEHERRIKAIRQAAKETGLNVAIMLDTKGPEIRLGYFKEEPVYLKKGDQVTLTTEPIRGDNKLIPITYSGLPGDVRKGDTILVADGLIAMRVLSATATEILCNVMNDGELTSQKGVNVPGVEVSLPAITDKDIQDIVFGVTQKLDYIAASFVRKAADVLSIRQIIEEAGGDLDIISKIESRRAVNNLDDIIKVSDGIMVARGDLGVEFGVEKVPALQKQIIKKARQALKPVITATQMLESMIENPQPTRAEASDVANAIWDGTDAVMLSAESAVGKHPREAVRYLHSIAADADANFTPRNGAAADNLEHDLPGRTDVSVAFAACRTAVEIGAKLIVVFTEGGGSARLVSRLAADVPVIGATTDIGNARRMGLLRGVESLLVPRTKHFSEMLASIQPLLKNRTGLQSGDRVVITLGHPLWNTGTTNMMRVETY